MPRRRTVLPLMLSAAAAAVAIPIVAAAAPGDPVLPDLVADAPERPLLGIHSRPDLGIGDRLLVRFDGFVHNRGPGPLEMRGSGNQNGVMTVVSQYARTEAGAMAPIGAPGGRTPVMRYESNDGHNHFHLMQIARYSLWSEDRSAQVAPGQKVGFCLVDSQRREGGGPSGPVYTVSGGNFCGQFERNRASVTMGISAGWRDLYHRDLAFQWVDVSETQPGRYWLASEIDTDDVVREADESNNGRRFASSQTVVPGYRALPVAPVDVAAGASVEIPLSAERFGSPGPVRYEVTRQPSRGQVTIQGSIATYRPGPGGGGVHSFAYAASDRNSDYPRNPAPQTVTLRVGAATAPTVTISGAPASLVAGTSAQLSATVVNAGPGVTWSASAGSISPGGLYVAPSTPPPGGAAEVRATSIDDPAAGAVATIAITPVPAPQPATGLDTTPVAAGGATPPGPRLTRTRIKRNGRIVVMWVTPRGGKGRIAIAGIRGGRAHDLCTRPAFAGRRLACKLVLPRRFADKPVRIGVGFKPAGEPKVTLSRLSRR